MKRYIILLSLAIILVLIGVITFKLSTDALAVIMGVGLGILASIPTSVLLYYMLTRQGNNSLNTPGSRTVGLPQNHHPPVVIVNGGNQPGLQAGPPPAQYQMEVPTQRTFTIVGEESTDL